ncbi:MAG: uroporphyrinogen-III synthase [Pseudolabrys sp.]
MRFAVTRPLPDGERTAAALRARGHEVLLTPLLRTEPVAADLSGDWAGVIVTSANALRAVTGQLAPLTALPLYAVGVRTAQIAREASFKTVSSAEGGAAALAELIGTKAAMVAGPLLYLAAEQRSADLEQLLKPHGVTVATKIVYRTVALPLPQPLIDALTGRRLDGVLHYSRRSAEALLAGAAVTGLLAPTLALRHVCLSDQIAAPLAEAGAKTIAVAATPDENAMISRAGDA